MTQIAKKSLAISIPLAFICASVGMLMLTVIDNSDGNFYQRLKDGSELWINAHIVLLLSAVLIIPTSLAVRTLVENTLRKVVADILVMIITFASVLLACQYAIDFVMILIVNVGGEALTVHKLLYQNSLIQILFYNLPNLTFLGLFILSILYAVDNGIKKRANTILVINWLCVILGNLISPEFQRVCIGLLAFTMLPIAFQLWNDKKTRL